jgi:oligoribonuclease (3'-5' exoribonuclease)
VNLPHHWSCQCAECKPTTPDAPIGVVPWYVNGGAVFYAHSWIEVRNACRQLGFEPESIETTMTDIMHVSELDNVVPADLETGGLNEQGDEILEVHIRRGHIRGGRFVEGARLNVVLPLQSNVYEWHPAVMDMHTKNGLLAECHKLTHEAAKKWGGRDGTSEHKMIMAMHEAREAAEHAMILLCPPLPEGQSYTLLGNSVHFDQRFFRRVFPAFSKRLSHRIIDCSTVRLFCESLGRPYVKGDPAHRASADVDHSIRLYEDCYDWVKAGCREPYPALQEAADHGSPI